MFLFEFTGHLLIKIKNYLVKKCLEWSVNVIRQNHTAFMFCRGGSKGVPNKNIRNVAGKPLLVWTIEAALASHYISRIVISTDSKNIANIARDAGSEVLIRPDHLATDEVPELLAWRHAIEVEHRALEGIFISLPATSPLRSVSDIDRGIERIYAGGCDIVFGITDAPHSPDLTIVTRDEEGLIELSNPNSNAVRRQEVPKVYNITSCIYVGLVDYLLSCSSIMSGRVASVEIPNERSVDIDTPFDLYLAEMLLKFPFRP